MNLPEGRRGQLVAIGLLVIVVTLLIQYLVLPLTHLYQRVDEDILDLRHESTRLQRLLATLPALTEAADKLSKNGPSTLPVLQGANAALAAAALQQYIRSAAKKSGARIVSLSVRPPFAEETLERVTVEAHMQMTIESLQDMLLSLERQIPYLFVDQLAISGRPVARRGDDTGDLDIRLTAYGMRNPPESPTRKGSRP